MKNKIIPYNSKLKKHTKYLSNNSNCQKCCCWNFIKNKSLEIEFHRQVPIDEFIVDFFCHELLLAIEIDGYSHVYEYDYDVSRQNKLESFGITILRFNDISVKKDMNNVLRVLQFEIERLKRKKSVY
ncbi:endonuclease domain-containing protein [Odoribacter sp. OttesenSCG-928-L07]|nr:endonuclease domain-containing protein [Odoribacter sp. OttesenSCG-928-L07]